MKKILFLSAMSAQLIYASGDSNADFWGKIGFRYDAQKLDTSANSWGKEDNKVKAIAILGVEKELGFGFGFGAELAEVYAFEGDMSKKGERAELSQFYVTYKNGNTAFKAGRQTLPITISPWAWSDRTAGVVNRAYNGVTVVNTDLANTTLIGAWIASFTDTTGSVKINGSNKGLFMLAVENRALKDTTLRTSLYYIPKNGSKGKAFSAWTTAETKINSVNLGLELAYVKADKGNKQILVGSKTKATFAAAAYAQSDFGALNAKLTLAYINNGNATLNLGGTGGFWTDTYINCFGGEVRPAYGKQKIAKLDLNYKLPKDLGSIYGGISVDKPTKGKTALGARAGYKFKISEITAKIEYRYLKNKDFTTRKDQRIRVEGYYKF